MKESYDCDCGICSICNGLRKPNEPHKTNEQKLIGCECMFENETSNTIILCEPCSKLPCHNKDT